MKILVTGAKGMVGTALVNQLKVIRDYPNQTGLNIRGEAILEYDVYSSLQVLEAYCKEADFVFHLAGVIKTDEQAVFMSGNLGFSQHLLIQGCLNRLVPMVDVKGLVASAFLPIK